MKKILLIVILLCSFCLSYAQEMIHLWPEGKMPNSKGLVLKDSVIKEHIYQVGEPRIYKYLASKENNTGLSILIIPGGGYARLMADYSNVSAALFYQKMGISAFVLCHRLPASPDLITPHTAPLEDAQRAMRVIHANAEKWGLDPNRIGVTGTSAGGHVASTLGTHLEDISKIGDELDKSSYKPAFMILVSPVITFKSPYLHKGSRDHLLGKEDSVLVEAYSNETRVTNETPATLLIHSDDDTIVPPFNSVLFYQALKEAKVSASLHIFPQGGHRLGVIKNPGSADMWTTMVIEWLKEMNFVR